MMIRCSSLSFVFVAAASVFAATGCTAASEEDVGSDSEDLTAVLGQQTDLGTLPEQCDTEANSGPRTSSVKAWENWNCVGPTAEYSLVLGQAYGVQRVSVRANFKGGAQYDLGLLDRFPQGGVAGPKAEWLGTVGDYSLIFRYGALASPSNPQLKADSYYVLAKVTPDAACVYDVLPSSEKRTAIYDKVRSPEYQAFTCPVARPRTIPSGQCGTLRAGNSISRGDSLSSCSGAFTLHMQHDGNLVLYRNADGYPKWDTKTAGTDASGVFLHANGALSLYNDSWNPNPYWSSEARSINQPGSFFAVQDDGNLVIYNAQHRPVWSSNTQE